MRIVYFKAEREETQRSGDLFSHTLSPTSNFEGAYLKGVNSYLKVVNYKNVGNFKGYIFVVDNFFIASPLVEIRWVEKRRRLEREVERVG